MHDEFRKTTSINTYSVASRKFEGIDATAEGVNYGSSKVNFGPNQDQLSTIR
jgi:hypothetical protein